MVGKSKEVRKKLITRKRECSARVGRSRAGDWWSGVCPEQWILDLLLESSIKRGEKLRNDRYVGPYLVKASVAQILQTRHNASDRPDSFGNERPQSYMVPDASHLDVKILYRLSMLRKYAW